MKRWVSAAVTAGGLVLSTLTVLGTTAAPASAQGDLPPFSGNTEWNPVFRAEFKKALEIGESGKAYVKQTDKGPVTLWRNLGNRPISECGTITGERYVLKSFPNGDGKKWQCRITANKSFGTNKHIFAARVKFHRDRGHLSSFWLNKANDGPTNEIDVFENNGFRKDAATGPDGEGSKDGCKRTATVGTNYPVGAKEHPFYGLNHAYYHGYDPHKGYKHCVGGRARVDALLNDDFHTVHAVWTPGIKTKFYIDGQLSAEFEDGNTGDTPVTAILTNIGEQGKGTFEVDWVRVWEAKVAGVSPQQELSDDEPTAPNPPATERCVTNECIRAEFGVYHYNYIANSSVTDFRLHRIVFDRQYYANAYPDVRNWATSKVQTQGGNYWDHVEWHWLNYGISQGRAGSITLDPAFYMAIHPDLVVAFGAGNYATAILHYVNSGRFEGRRASLLFDPSYYKSRYGDMSSQPNWYLTDHFNFHGIDEGRQGSADFGPAYYMGQYHDLRVAFQWNNYRSGAIHWLTIGRYEGRRANP